MLFITALSAIGSIYDYYSIVYEYLGDSVGYSLTTNAVFVFLYFRKSFCVQTKIAVGGLIAMNVVSLALTGSDNYLYSKAFDLWLILIITVLTLITLIKWKF